MAKKKVEPVVLDVDDMLKMLFYSPAGHGKTTLLGTAIGDPRLCPMLFVDFEAGTKSIKSKIKRIELDQLGKVKPAIDKAHAVRIKEWEDFNVVYNFLANEDHGYQSVAIDSLTEVNYLNLTTIVGKEVELGDHDPDIAYQEDYLRSIAQMRKLIRFFRDLPLHVFFTAGAMESIDARTKKMQYRPGLTGKLSMELPGLVDTIGYLSVVEDDDETFRCLFVQPTEKFMAKDRSEGGILGDEIEEPTLPEILDILLGEVEPNRTEEEDEE
jgi:hypothetical protein